MFAALWVETRPEFASTMHLAMSRPSPHIWTGPGPSQWPTRVRSSDLDEQSVSGIFLSAYCDRVMCSLCSESANRALHSACSTLLVLPYQCQTNQGSMAPPFNCKTTQLIKSAARGASPLLDKGKHNGPEVVHAKPSSVSFPVRLFRRLL